MVINDRCNICRTKKEHLFAECLASTCQCKCVEQIYKMPKNENEDDITSQHPLFLEVSAPEVTKLPNRDWDISNFSRVKKSEWIDSKKKDKRRKNASLPNYFGH